MATDERNYVLRFCDGTVTIGPDQLVVQGAPHDNGRPRKPVLTERTAITTLHLRCGLFGATLKRETPAGYRSHVIRVEDARPLLQDLQDHAWPLELAGWRRPRT
ncbi:hypothetical protein ACE2AJ_05480 [Aquihabitans daechungensis]|uniref:hypothetical protein n=1 Tax=Aquihabitans daechungensis TaxID=1052257 RepID=UPI003BA1D28F